MPNIKSAIKRVKINEKKKDQNKAFKSKLATFIKKFNQAAEAKDVAGAEKLFVETTGLLDKAVGANILHKNNAARKKSALALKLKEANGGKAPATTPKVKAATASETIKAVKEATAKEASKAPAKKTSAKK